MEDLPNHSATQEAPHSTDRQPGRSLLLRRRFARLHPARKGAGGRVPPVKGISVFWKMVMIFTAICIVPMVLFVSYMYEVTSREIRDNAHHSLAQSLVKTQDIVYRQMQRIEFSCDEMLQTNLLTKFLVSDFSYTGEDILYFNNMVYPFFSLRKRLLPEVYSIWIYTRNEDLPFSWDEDTGIVSMAHYQPLPQPPGVSTDFWWSRITEAAPILAHNADAPGEVFSYSRIIRSPFDGSHVGVIDYRIALDSLFAALVDQSNNQSGTLYLVDATGTVLFCGRADAAGHTLAQLYPDGGTLFEPGMPAQYSAAGTAYIVGSEYIPALQCSIVSVRSLADIQAELKKANAWMMLALLAAFGVVALLVPAAAYGIMKRVRTMAAAIERVDQGDYSVVVHPGADDEFGLLIRAFNGMLAKINELINNVYRIQISEQQAQLRALEAQVNPHFLYNTLTSIAGAAKEGDNTAAHRMALSLGKFYRTGLSKNAEPFTVTEELDYLEQYLTIQGIRFGERISYLFEIDKRYQRCKILRNVLQPLVENAINHGLKDTMQGGVITIGMTRQGDCLLFEVRDNGAGLSSELLQAINTGQLAGEISSGYGLKNVNDRLLIYYGPEYGLQARSRPGQGTSVFVRVPIRW